MSQVGEILDTAWASMIEFFNVSSLTQGEVVSAIIILVVGLIGGRLVSQVVRRLLKMTALDDLALKADIQQLLRKLDYSGTVSDLLADLTKYLIYLFVLFALFSILEVQVLRAQLQSLFAYVPRLVIALFVVILGSIVSSHAGSITMKIFRAGPMSQRIDESEASLPAYRVVGGAIKLIGYIATILISLAILGINRYVIYILMTVFITALAVIVIVAIRDIVPNVAISIYFQLSRTLSAGDIVELEEVTGEITRITPLYTVVEDGDDQHFVPNTVLISNTMRHDS